MPRPIGARIREVCEILEAIGPSPIADIWPWTTEGQNRNQTQRYLNRAMSHALIRKDGDAYIIRPNWRENLAPTPSKYTVDAIRNVIKTTASKASISMFTERPWRLTAMEIVVNEACIRGERTFEIAKRLGLKESTVNTHSASIRKKMKVRTTLAAAVIYDRKTRANAAALVVDGEGPKIVPITVMQLEDERLAA